MNQIFFFTLYIYLQVQISLETVEKDLKGLLFYAHTLYIFKQNKLSFINIIIISNCPRELSSVGMDNA